MCCNNTACYVFGISCIGTFARRDDYALYNDELVVYSQVNIIITVYTLKIWRFSPKWPLQVV